MGTYRCAPESASSRSRYAPAGQSSVGTWITGSQSVTTVLVGWVTAGRFCRPPRTGPEDQTRRAPVPWYQPSRNAVTRKPRDLAETNSGNGSPVSTLDLPAYPSMSCSPPRCRSAQCGSPGFEFSGAGGRRVLRGSACWAPDGPEAVVHPAAAPATPAAARPRNARRLVFGSIRVSMPRSAERMRHRRARHNQLLRIEGGQQLGDGGRVVVGDGEEHAADERARLREQPRRQVEPHGSLRAAACLVQRVERGGRDRHH